jgi:hypothetical protein
MIQSTSEVVFKQLWTIYFAGKLGRLAVHPVANFVVSAAFAKLDEESLTSVVVEMSKVIPKNISKCVHLDLRFSIIAPSCWYLMLIYTPLHRTTSSWTCHVARQPSCSPEEVSGGNSRGVLISMLTTRLTDILRRLYAKQWMYLCPSHKALLKNSLVGRIKR